MPCHVMLCRAMACRRFEAEVERLKLVPREQTETGRSGLGSPPVPQTQIRTYVISGR